MTKLILVMLLLWNHLISVYNCTIFKYLITVCHSGFLFTDVYLFFNFL